MFRWVPCAPMPVASPRPSESRWRLSKRKAGLLNASSALPATAVASALNVRRAREWSKRVVLRWRAVHGGSLYGSRRLKKSLGEGCAALGWPLVGEGASATTWNPDRSPACQRSASRLPISSWAWGAVCAGARVRRRAVGAVRAVCARCARGAAPYSLLTAEREHDGEAVDAGPLTAPLCVSLRAL